MHQVSIQQKLEEALSIYLRAPVAIIGAGRTDTGVHAKEMFAHFDYPTTLPEDIVYRVNSLLPKDIAIISIKMVRDDAHARFHALERSYEYYISLQKDPFKINFSWQMYRQKPDLESMNKASLYLIGTQNFKALAKEGSDNKTDICSVSKAEWSHEDEFVLKFTITADRFLRNMVRATVGTLVSIGLGKYPPQHMQEVLMSKKRSNAGASAPAEGLYLCKILYPEDIFI